MPELNQSIVIEAPVERVWSEVTKIQELNRALMDSVLETELEPGAPVYYRSKNGRRVLIVGRILEVDPPHRLVLRWQLTMRKDPPSVVTWILEPEATGTRVTITHDFPEGVKLKGYESTWSEMLSNLKAVLEQGELPLVIRIKYAVMGAATFALPPSTKPDRVTIPD